MGAASTIEWTEATWNPIVGCSIVSPGCTHCYAMRTAARMNVNPATPHYRGTVQDSKAGPVWTGKVALAPERTLLEPLRRKKPTTYFVNSMGDLFHESVPDAWIDRVFAVMALTPQHTYQVLTKRAERMREYVEMLGARCDGEDGITDMLREVADRAMIDWRRGSDRWPLPNVWLGVSTERQQEADERIPNLLATPAAVRFISAEPLLGPIDLTRITYAEGKTLDAVSGGRFREGEWNGVGRALDWVIVGGESGPNARPMHPQWARDLRDQCKAAGVPFFFKQWGEWLPWHHFNDLEIDDDSEQTRYRTMEWDGDRFNDVGYPQWCDTVDGNIDDEQCVARLGKKAAGRLLDGVEHNAMPRRAA